MSKLYGHTYVAVRQGIEEAEFIDWEFCAISVQGILRRIDEDRRDFPNTNQIYPFTRVIEIDATEESTVWRSADTAKKE